MTTGQKGEPVSARRTATRNRLADAAITVFARKGVAGSSVEEICEEAGFTRGAFYSNFDSRTELCREVVRRYTEQCYRSVHEAVPPHVDASQPVRAQLEAALQAFTGTVVSDVDTIIAMTEIRLEAARNPELRAAFAEITGTFGPRFTQILQDALEANGIDLGLPIDEFVDDLHAVFDYQILETLIGDGRIDLQRASRRLATLVSALLGLD